MWVNAEKMRCAPLLTRLRFIEENNEYKNQQKEIQRKRGSPPGMAPQELMMYWGKESPWKVWPFANRTPRLQV